MASIWKQYKYKNLTLAGLSLVLTITLIRFQSVHELLLSLKDLGYVGAFISGMLFTSVFTVGIGAVLLLIFAEQLHIVELAIIAGLGAVMTDLLIFSFIRSKGLTKEITRLAKTVGATKIHHLIHTRYFAWTLPILGAIIIASPLPDEFGISLLGISQLSKPKFILMCFVLDFLGIIAILAASNYIKP